MAAAMRQIKWRITASFEPVLDNAFLCAGGTVDLDPVAGDQNTDLEYEWTYNGNVVDDVNDNEWEVSETGSYCVTITDGCFPDGESDAPSSILSLSRTSN